MDGDHVDKVACLVHAGSMLIRDRIYRRRIRKQPMVIMANVVWAVADAAADWIWVPFEVVVVGPPAPVVQVTWPMVNVRPSATKAKAGMMTILFV